MDKQQQQLSRLYMAKKSVTETPKKISMMTGTLKAWKLNNTYKMKYN